MPSFSAPEEGTIIATGGNSAGIAWDDSHIGLIDNDGLSGLDSEVNQVHKKCADQPPFTVEFPCVATYGVTTFPINPLSKHIHDSALMGYYM